MFKKYGIALLSAMLILSLTGCGKMQTKSAKPNQSNARSTARVEMKNAAHPSTNKAVSERIGKQVSKIKGVSKATVIVHRRDAIVGIDVKQGENAKAVETKVRQAVQGSEPGFAVHVTSDKQHHARIQNLHSQMVPLDGHPVRNFSEDVGILLRDMGRTVTAPFR